MSKLSLIVAAALAFWSLSASAQSPSTAPTSNSGAGVQGMPGNKSGPSVRPNTSPNAPTGQSATTPQDAARLPGAPGSKSGPAVKPESEKN